MLQDLPVFEGVTAVKSFGPFGRDIPYSAPFRPTDAAAPLPANAIGRTAAPVCRVFRFFARIFATSRRHSTRPYFAASANG